MSGTSIVIGVVAPLGTLRFVELLRGREVAAGLKVNDTHLTRRIDELLGRARPSGGSRPKVRTREGPRARPPKAERRHFVVASSHRIRRITSSAPDAMPARPVSPATPPASTASRRRRGALPGRKARDEIHSAPKSLLLSRNDFDFGRLRGNELFTDVEDTVLIDGRRSRATARRSSAWPR